MNKAKLKSYAPAARRNFIQAVTDRAHFYGLSESEIIPVEENGDVAIIGGRPFPRAVAAQRKKLEERVKLEGFQQVMEAVAYTWFNRFLALRYMELHDYLEHGFRILSNAGSSIVPEILDHASELDLPGLNKQKVVELKLDGSRDAELYRLLLVAQCNALSNAMPFLFEKIEDETELLLPDNLLHSDSLIRKLVSEIEAEDWQEVEIIGWLYQFYISEKKDQVIGKVVKSEDISAATQLFTPNWIVKYMVQNSLGRQWLATYPVSPLKAKMEYYIEPAEQTDEVKTQLAAITPDSLDPEKMTLLDPASGSGHILVEAYDVFKEIYLERGYSSRDFPRLILEKNLYGLDIDDRAAQMAGFALLMKARKDDRRILRSDNPVKLNVMAIQESGSIAVENSYWGKQANSIQELIELFKYGKTFGSLIQVSEKLAEKLPVIEEALKQALNGGDLYVSQVAYELLPLVKQAEVLGKKFDCVVANPPYMGSGYHSSAMRAYLKDLYKGYDKDLFSAFVIRSCMLTHKYGHLGFMTPFVWMFISSYEPLRKQLINNAVISTLVQLEYSGFEGATVPICTFTCVNGQLSNFKSSFVRLSDFKGSENQGPKTLEAIDNPKCGWFYNSKPTDFLKIPGSPIGYWINCYDVFSGKKLADISVSGGRCKTHDDANYIRMLWEVAANKIGDGKKWKKFDKGGDFRKYYGNQWYIVDWSDEAKTFYASHGGLSNSSFWNKEGITWPTLTSAISSFRIKTTDSEYGSVSPTIFFENYKCNMLILGLLNSKVSNYFIKVINPTLALNVGDILNFPLVIDDIPLTLISDRVIELLKISKYDWDCLETSIDFKWFPYLTDSFKSTKTSETWQNWQNHCSIQFTRMQELETENNRLFIEAYELQNELTPEVPEDQITLSNANREADMKRLVSYAIGCMMGRYSLDQPGLVYANIGNVDFDQTKYQVFPADDDGIVPVMDIDWFPDDAASRFEEFLKVAWSPETLEENLKFVADSLSPKGGETPRETIRRYISTTFYKDHLQTYKKRPIYWLFSSGKQRAFECLVYLHRYNEATLSRMRNEYITPLQGKFSAQADYLDSEVNAATSTAERNRLQKQLDTLRKKQVELAAFDDLLRHYADQSIGLDLDAGVKVNYGKFGNLLTDVKAVTGSGD